MSDEAVLLQLPAAAASAMETNAARAGRRFSWSIEDAWNQAGKRLVAEALNDEEAPPPGAFEADGTTLAPHRAMRAFLSASILAAMRAEAGRRGCSLSTMVMHAWKVSRRH